MKRTFAAILTVAGLLAACGGDDGMTTYPTSPYQLTFQGDGTFGPHAGQDLRAALLRVSDNAILDRQAATVGAALSNPSFSVTFTPMLDPATAYRVHYWIDSNFAAGTIGTCDPPANDHQWSLDMPMGQALYKDTHRPAAVSDVCASFLPYTLTFEGDGTFTGPHGGQPIAAALIRDLDGAVLERMSGTVAASGSPSFSFAFTPSLDPVAHYTVNYWIDSNFVSGTVGVCDLPAYDHQWSVPMPRDQALYTDTHRPAAVTDVCASFP